MFFFAEVNDRQRAYARVTAVGNGKRGDASEFLGYDHCRNFVEVFTPVFLGHFDSEQPQFTTTPEEIDSDVPFLVLDLFDLREDLVFNELFGHVPDHCLLFREILWREDVPGDQLLNEETSTFFYSYQFFCHSVVLDPLKYSRGTHSAADAHCDHSVSCSASSHFIKKRGRQFRACAAQRMCESDGPAIHINLRWIQTYLSNDGEGLDGKCLIQLNQINI